MSRGTSPPAPPERRELAAWCLYDFANSAFTTLVVTFLYSTYFTKAMVGDEVRGTQLWSWGVSGSFLAVALLSPAIGAHADAGGRRGRHLMGLSLICIVCTAGLAFVPPPSWALALVLFALANFAYESSQAVYNAYLPELTTTARVGRLSGYGWALGYAGGLLSLVIGFTMTGLPDGAGGWRLEPWLSTEGGWNVRATNLLVAGWFLVFAIPAFRLLQDRSGASTRKRAPFREVLSTLRELGRYRQTARFLVARLIYNDGLVTVFSFGGIYAAGTLGMSFGEIVLLGIWLNVVAGIGAAAFGHLDDRLGGKLTVAITLVVLIGATVLGASAGSSRTFWIAATAIGLMVGPNQAASRSLMARFSPTAHRAEFFGFFALSGKLTAFLGPLVLGQVTAWSGSQRWGMASVAGFLLLGLILLLGLDEGRATAEAQQD